MNFFEKVFDTVRNGNDKLCNFVENCALGFSDWLTLITQEPTLEQTLEEKVGGGPHGYGDPRDASIREVEQYLFPRMIWKKIRYEKCFTLVEQYYTCVNQSESGQELDCQKAESAMFACKAHYNSLEGIEEVEKECIIQYLKLRSKFRETGSSDDLWNLKMLMLEPSYDKYYQAYKRGASKDELDALEPKKLKPVF